MKDWCLASFRQARQVVLVGVNDQFQAVRDGQLFEDRGQVMAHRHLAQEELVGDLLVLEAFPDQGDDLAARAGLTGRSWPSWVPCRQECWGGSVG